LSDPGPRIAQNEMEIRREDVRIMKKSELDRFRKALEDRQADLTAVRSNREALAIETSADELDRIQHAQERDFAMGAIDRESSRLREVRAALERVANGSFGICLNCEEDISAKRLAAVPWTALCIVCQEAADRSGDSQDADEESLVDAA
jgi:DnaK suppressor protein